MLNSSFWHPPAIPGRAMWYQLPPEIAQSLQTARAIGSDPGRPHMELRGNLKWNQQVHGWVKHSKASTASKNSKHSKQASTASKQTSKQANKQAQEASKQASKQASNVFTSRRKKQASRQASRQAQQAEQAYYSKHIKLNKQAEHESTQMQEDYTGSQRASSACVHIRMDVEPCITMSLHQKQIETSNPRNNHEAPSLR